MKARSAVYRQLDLGLETVGSVSKLIIILSFGRLLGFDLTTSEHACLSARGFMHCGRLGSDVPCEANLLCWDKLEIFGKLPVHYH